MRKLSAILLSFILIGLSQTVFAATSPSIAQQQQYMQAFVQNLYQKQQALVQAEAVNNQSNRPAPSTAYPVMNNPQGVSVPPPRTSNSPTNPSGPTNPNVRPQPASPWLRPNPWSNTTFNPWAPAPPSTNATTNQTTGPGGPPLPAVPNIYSPSGTNRALPGNIYK